MSAQHDLSYRRPGIPHLRAIIWLQKVMILLAVVTFPLFVAVMVLDVDRIFPGLTIIMLLLFLACYAGTIVAACVLAILTIELPLAVIYGVMGLFPVFGLVIVIVINSEVNKLLEQNQIETGHFGAVYSKLRQ